MQIAIVRMFSRGNTYRKAGIIFIGLVELLLVFVVIAALFAVWRYPLLFVRIIRYPGSVPCIFSSGATFCYRRRALEYVSGEGPGRAQTFVSALFAAGALDFKECHQLMHAIGQHAARRTTSLEELLRGAQPFCTNGYAHGVLEGFFREYVRHGTLQSAVQEVCEQYEGQRTNTASACFHGLGHSIVYSMQNELRGSLALCDRLEDQWGEKSCYDGAFMEYALFAAMRSGDRKRSSQSFSETCLSLGESYGLRCYWRGMPLFFFLETAPEMPSPHYLAAVASGIPWGLERAFWFGIGREADTATNSDPQRLKEFCGELPIEVHSFCLSGAARHMIVADGGEVSSSADLLRIFAICPSLSV